MTCRLWIGFACSSAPGVRPGSRPTFFASPKKVIKERRPDGSAPGYRGSLRYSQTGGQPDNSPLSTGTQTGPAVAVYRSYPGLLRCSAQPTGEHNSARFASPTPGSPLRGEPLGRCAASRMAVALPRVERRAWDWAGGRRKKVVRVPNEVRASSFFSRRPEPKLGDPKGAKVGSPFFAYFLWRSKESRSAAGPKPRRAATQRTTKKKRQRTQATFPSATPFNQASNSRSHQYPT